MNPEVSASSQTLATASQAPARFQTFKAFYPFYLNEHANPVCRRLHFVGSLGALACLAKLVLSLNFMWLGVGILWGYGMAWIGHFVFEKNKPASFKQPLFSFMGDWKMFWQMITGKIPF